MTVTTERPALDLVGMYPDLFEGLDQEYVDQVTNIWAMQWHEGWVPNRGDLADFLAVDAGTMTRLEAGQRAIERGRARRSGRLYSGDAR